MLKSISKIIFGAIGRLIYAFLWIILLGICINEFDTFWATIAGLIITGIFFFLHAIRLFPNNWHYGRTKCIWPKRFYFLLLIAIVLVLGDVFWIFHIKTSVSTFEEDPWSFVVLGIIAFPLIEEFGFRLWLQSYLEEKVNKLFAVLFIAFLFALFHKPEMPIPQLLSGVFYGLILISTRSIWIGVFMHLFHNAVLILSGKIRVVQEVSFQLMDRTDQLNLILAICFWVLAALGILQWLRWNKGLLKTT